MTRPGARELSLPQAVALGLLHGPTELLPVSSSAHTTLVPWLLGWRYGELDPALRKSFEVSLHAGTAVGLLASRPWRADERGSKEEDMRAGRAWLGVPATGAGPASRIAMLAGATAPPAIAGFVLGDRIERQFGTPRTIAVGLFVGAVVMATAELRARRPGGAAGGLPGSSTGSSAGESPAAARCANEAGPRDGLALGAAQALALIPGLSRSGMAFAAARARGFRRAQADRLGWQAGLPVIAGATLLKGVRQARGGVAAQERAGLATGAGAALLSTYLSARLLTPDRRMRLLGAAIGYRFVLAGAMALRMRGHDAGTPDQSHP